MKKIFTVILLTFIISTSFSIIINANEFDPNNYIDDIKTLKYLSDRDSSNRYIIYEGEEKGYLIYDTISTMVVEYSKESISPYKNLENALYYFGPLNYVHKELNNFVDYYDNVVSLNDYTSLQKISPTKNIEKNNNNNNRSSSEIRVDNSFYFEKLDGIKDNGEGTNYFPNNTSDDCGYVCATILLSYYDTFYNDNIISDSYISSVNNSTYNKDNLIYVPCANMQFKNLLHTYSIFNQTYSDIIKSVIDDYLENNTNTTSSIITTSQLIPSYSVVTNMIDNNIVPILFGRFTYLIDDTEYSTNAHSIIAYGYDGDFLITHFGWRGYPEVYVNYEYWLIDSAVASSFHMTFINGSHVHSDNIKINNHSYCFYDNYHISPYDFVYEQYLASCHKVMCSCGLYYGEEAHDFGTRATINPLAIVKPNPTYKQCIKCGYIVIN